MGKKYSKDEIDFIINNYNSLGAKEVSRILNRPYRGIVRKAFDLGITIPHTTDDVVKRLTAQEIGYFAGIIDGEGTLTFCVKPLESIKQSIVEPWIMVSNTNEDLMIWLTSNLGFRSFRRIRPSGRDLKFGFTKPYFTAQMHGKKIQGILKSIHPLLIVKKKQCEYMIDFINSRTEKARKELPYSNLEKTCFWNTRKLNISDKRFQELEQRIKSSSKTSHIMM